ncbi:hypothetical protein [Deinococcus roseus]|uniref:Uncharacterized protein n=1 Tax=Deinococcus roseus TaxID=392414 RepID=A0ABQ2D1X6_9DEIO|nr:hypothetical protein [Deinococcus roseus]GGJ36576.1 hypothetical protein GCM10008938_23410 [Deinococcus roseus]
MTAYGFTLKFSSHERYTPNLQKWIETLTGQTVTLHFTHQMGWWPHQQCEVHLMASRSDAIAFYNLMLQHYRIETLQTL